MIHKVDGFSKDENGYTISSNQCWLPGIYDSQSTARYAFQFSDEILTQLRNKINRKKKRSITLEDLRKSK
jgi:hypothetical protein